MADQNQIQAYCEQFVPFGSLDIHAAIDAAIAAGHTPEWAADQVTEFMDSTRCKISDVDPVYAVYESILQEARNEIEEETSGYDLLNDGDGSIYTYGNYLDTSYDYREEDVAKLKKRLKKCRVVFSDLSQATQWFLNEIGITK